MEPKSAKMMSWKHLVSRMAPKWPPDALQDRFCKHVRTFLKQVCCFVSDICLVNLICIIYKHVANNRCVNHLRRSIRYRLWGGWGIFLTIVVRLSDIRLVTYSYKQEHSQFCISAHPMSDTYQQRLCVYRPP